MYRIIEGRGRVFIYLFRKRTILQYELIQLVQIGYQLNFPMV